MLILAQAVPLTGLNLSVRGDLPSKLKFEDLQFINFSGTASTNTSSFAVHFSILNNSEI